MVAYRLRRLLVLGALFALIPLLPPVRAQYAQAPPAKETYGDASRDWTGDIPAHLAFVEGEVTLERDGKLEPAEPNLALLAGDRLRTRGGRVEILFADGSTLAVDEETELDLLSDSLVRLIDGRLRLTIPRTTEELDYRIDAPAAFVEIRTAGEYRVDTGVDQRGDPDVDLTVFRGSAELVNNFGRTLVRAGRHAVASAATEPSLPTAVNTSPADEFDRWSEDRRAARIATASAAYLPEEERYYSSALDTYGTWGTEAQYGAVWYPSVAADWRPYSQGRWSYTAHYGWLWVGIDRWSWPTHHYGRWGASANRWYWIPDRRWAPAWVAWGSAPGFVSWCPLGFDGRPVVGFGGPLGIRYMEPFLAWTVLPANRFTHNVWVTEHVVAKNIIPPTVRAEFVERRVAPAPVGLAVPRREIAPLHAPTTPRDTAVRRTRATDGPFDAARPGGRTGGAGATRGAVTSTIIGEPVRGGDDPRGSSGARATTPDRTSSTPSRTPRPTSPTIDVSRVSSPQRVASPQIDVPQPDPNRPATPRAIPRSIDQPAPPPPATYDSPRTNHRTSEPARVVPPPSAAPPPSRGRSSEPPAARPPAAQPSNPPPSPPPPSRGGGGGDQGKAVPRRGGGGGGGG